MQTCSMAIGMSCEILVAKFCESEVGNNELIFVILNQENESNNP